MESLGKHSSRELESNFNEFSEMFLLAMIDDEEESLYFKS